MVVESVRMGCFLGYDTFVQNKIGEVTVYGRTYACVSLRMETQIQFKNPRSATTQLNNNNHLSPPKNS